jgi:hypothetical protein
VAIRFSESAARHGISRDRARYVVERCRCPLYSSDPADENLVVFLGPDPDGIPIEVVGIELAVRDLLLIHVMKLRRRYRADYARVMECLGL